MAKNPRFYLPAKTLEENLSKDSISETNPLLTPKQAAQIIGMSEKWLASARAGLKVVNGPPFIKLGEGRTAPIRYKLSSLQTWVTQFGEVINTSGATPAACRSFHDFQSRAVATDRWLFAIDPGTKRFDEFFQAVLAGQIKSATALKWLSNDEVSSGRVFYQKLALSEHTYQALLRLGGGDPSRGLQELVKRSGK